MKTQYDGIYKAIQNTHRRLGMRICLSLNETHSDNAYCGSSGRTYLPRATDAGWNQQEY